ncbi:alpha/beta hydrolase [Thalassomonas sp. RHCl1]|uniref:alpha/beta fold hydrolase n=1 Tax=Thalassomonas sp. RHCl1 TaxID=2995320 RepID=UPI00248CF09C|nr:alpha/beta hydrolase [Thalassomonas sp. RHCl1]
MSQALLNKALNNYSSNKREPALDAFEPRFIKVGGFDIRYLYKEKQDAPTLVLLNGLPQSIRMWESSLEKFSAHFNVIAFDIPGFGLSKAKESDMSPSNLGQVIIRVLDHFKIQKAHLVGPDVGVPITLSAVINHPKRFESINIFDGPGTYPPKLSPILMAVIKFGFVRWLAKGLNKKSVMKTNFLTAVKEGYYRYRPSRRAIKEYYDITHNDASHRSSISFFATYSTELPWIEKRLKDIKVPTLITWGKQDPFVLVENADVLSKAIPNNKVVIFENASHFSSEDAGEEYVDALTHWCLHEYKKYK